MGDDDAHLAAALALDADALGRHVRRASAEVGGDHLDQLALVDGAPPQLEVDGDVVPDRGRGREGLDELGVSVDGPAELVDVAEVPERLDAARGRAGPDRDEDLRMRADLRDPLEVRRGRDRPLHEREVVRPREDPARRLPEVGDLDAVGDGEEVVLAVEERQLASVARGELEDPELGVVRWRHPTAPGRTGTVARPCRGRPGRSGRRIRARAGSGHRSRSRTSYSAPARRRWTRPSSPWPRGLAP